MTLDECTEEIATYSRQNHELPEGLGWRIHTEHMHEYRVRKTQFIKLQTIEATKENHPKGIIWRDVCLDTIRDRIALSLASMMK